MQTSKFTTYLHTPSCTRKAWILLVSLLLCISTATASEPRPSPHELAAIASTLGPRAWHHEREFADNPLLRAARDIGMGLVNATPTLRRSFIREAAGLTGDLPSLMKP